MTKKVLPALEPKEGAKNAGERRPIALLPQVYRLWSACCRADVLKWHQLCKDRGEPPVGQGALDETFDLAYLTESVVLRGNIKLVFSANATSGFRSICLKSLPLKVRKQTHSGAGCCYSEGVTATCGLPRGCGHAVDLLHAFLIMSPDSPICGATR
eukprot:4776157-Amphidinium_carterae.7